MPVQALRDGATVSTRLSIPVPSADATSPRPPPDEGPAGYAVGHGAGGEQSDVR